VPYNLKPEQFPQFWGTEGGLIQFVQAEHGLFFPAASRLPLTRWLVPGFVVLVLLCNALPQFPQGCWRESQYALTLQWTLLHQVN
jgi:hypothetical protein